MAKAREEQLHIKITRATKKALMANAEVSGHSLSSYCRFVLERSYCPECGTETRHKVCSCKHIEGI